MGKWLTSVQRCRAKHEHEHLIFAIPTISNNGYVLSMFVLQFKEEEKEKTRTYVFTIKNDDRSFCRCLHGICV